MSKDVELNQSIFNQYHFTIMKLSTRFISLTITLLFSFLLLSCDNSTDHDHDHDEPPAGINLLSSGAVIASQNGTNISYPTGNAISIGVNETITFEVQFLHDDGDAIEYHEDEGYSLEFQNKNSDVIAIAHLVSTMADDHDHDSDHWSLQLTGVASGSATFAVELMHAGHSDFLSRDFTVEVTP